MWYQDPVIEKMTPGRRRRSRMSGQVLGATTTLPGLAGVALLPNTGSTKVLFYAASTLFVGGVVILVVGMLTARRNKELN